MRLNTTIVNKLKRGEITFDCRVDTPNKSSMCSGIGNSVFKGLIGRSEVRCDYVFRCRDCGYDFIIEGYFDEIYRDYVSGCEDDVNRFNLLIFGLYHSSYRDGFILKNKGEIKKVLEKVIEKKVIECGLIRLWIKRLLKRFV